MRLPGLIDPHVHTREPGSTHKENWDSGTSAALAGGFTMILSMPNTAPPVTDQQTLNLTLASARNKSRCDYAQFLGAGHENIHSTASLASQVAGLKMYLDQTFGSLRLDELDLWMKHLQRWPLPWPVAVHAEGRSLAAMIALAAVYNRPVHLCHVSRREEILLIRAAKEKGIQVTCEVTPHHLFLCEEDLPSIGAKLGEVRPRLATRADQQALWDNLAVIDCFATDHAPHTLAEKKGDTPPPGFPGLETALPLFLSAVNEGRLTIDDIILRMANNPRKIFSLPEQPETWVEVDLKAKWNIVASLNFSRSGWTPFEGFPVTGKITQVYLRGQVAYKNGQVFSAPGNGMNVRATYQCISS